jgi:hypothetical protein
MQLHAISLKHIYFTARNLMVAVLSGLTLLACNSLNSVMTDNNNTLAANTLIIEKSASIPVLAGKPTLSGVYVRNTTGKAISGIYYALIQNGNTNSLSIDSHSCTTIAPNSSCLLPLTTPALSLGDSGSNLIVANYDDVQSKQLINYHYVDTQNYTGINFSDGSQKLFGTNDYATVYAFAGKSQSFTNVGFEISNNSLAISGGLTNGKVDIPANRVIPLEIQSNQNVTTNLVSVTPYSATDSKNLASMLNGQLQNNVALQVVITPTLQANLLMGNLPILTQSTPTATLTVLNNGNQDASTISLASDNSNITVTTAATNPCTVTLAVGASCNYTITLNNSTTNGSALLTLSYNNTQGNVTATQVAYYKNTPSEPMVTVIPAQTTLTEQINASQNVLFNITNTSNVPLNNPQINIKTTLANTILSPYQNNCSNTTLNPNSSCSLYVVVAASSLIDNGAIYLTVTGNYTGASTNNYSFASNAVYTTVYDPSIPTVTSTTPQDAQTNINNSSSIIVNFSESMTPTTLNNTTILLKKVSDGSSIALTSQGVSNNNQTVTFSQSSGALLNYTQYQIVIKPSQIKNIHDNPMGTAAESVIASFTTGDFIAPTVSSTSPTNGATAVSRVTAINIAFSESMAQSTLTTSNILLQTQAGVTVASYSLSYNPATYTVTLAPALALNSNTTYKILLNQPNITDLAGNALGTNSAYQLAQFTTNSTTVPTLSSTVPVNGAIDIAVESSISLTFSVAMNTATLTASNIKLQRVANGSYVTLNTPAYSNGNKTVTFTPSTSLNTAESYNIIIYPNQITSNAGIAISAADTKIVSNFYTIGGWTRQAGTTSKAAQGKSIVTDSNGNIYIAGSTTGRLSSGVAETGYQGYFVAKYNNSGTLQWTQVYFPTENSYVEPKGIAIDSSANVYITGYTTGTLPGQTKIGGVNYFIAKYNSAGQFQKNIQIGISTFDLYTYGIKIDSSDNLYIVGHNSKSGLYTKYFITKYDNSLNQLWIQESGSTSGYSMALGIALDSSGNAYVTGDTTKKISSQNQQGSKDYFIAKWSSAGVIQWSKQVGASDGYTSGYGVAVDSASNAYVTGTTSIGISSQTLNGTQDYFIAQYDSSGNLQKTNLVGASGGTVYAYGIAVNSSNQVFITGNTDTSISGQSIFSPPNSFIAQYDNTLTLKWTKIFSGANNYGYGIAADSNSNSYITGYTKAGLNGQTQTGSQDYFVIKYFRPN